MTQPSSSRVPETLDVAAVRVHLERTGWSLTDADTRTTLWTLGTDGDRPLAVVLPVGDTRDDIRERLGEALRTVAYAERRSISEVLADLSFAGGADMLSVRFTPAGAPSGSAPSRPPSSSPAASPARVAGCSSPCRCSAPASSASRSSRRSGPASFFSPSPASAISRRTRRRRAAC